MIDQKVILVTGASSGIGAATIKLFAQRDWAVVLAARSKDKIQTLANAITAAGGQAVAIATDVTKREEITNMVQQTMAHFGRIDVLVNNAAQGMRATVAEVDLDDLEYLFRLNVFAPVATLQAVTPIMKQQGGGVIINVSSLAENMAIPFMSPYAASKIALSYLSDAARAELAHANIGVVSLLPGRTKTNFAENALRSGDGGDYNLRELMNVREHSMGENLATAEDVAAAVWTAVKTHPRQQYVNKSDQVLGSIARHNPDLLNKLVTVALNRYVPRQGQEEPPASLAEDLTRAGLVAGGLAVAAVVAGLWGRRNGRQAR